MNDVNVLTANWVPVVDKHCVTQIVSPYDVFRNDYIQFAGDPVENLSLIRFFLALSQAPVANQCTNWTELKKLRNTYVEDVLKYMDQNIDLFWMGGDKPFLQCTESELGVNTKGSEMSETPLQLREVHAKGNNPLLGQMHNTSYNDPVDVILDLLVRQTFSVAYGKSGARPTRSMIWDKSTLGIINFHIETDTIIDTIWANFHRSDSLSSMPFGVPVWESRFNPAYSHTYLNRLVSLSCKMIISNDLQTMQVNTGIDYPNLADPFISMETVGEELIPIRQRHDTRIWKEYSKIFANNARKPEIFDDRLCELTSISISSLGGIYKFSMGTYSTESFSTSVYAIPNPSKIAEAEYTAFYKDAVSIADELCKAFNTSFYAIYAAIKYDSRSALNMSEKKTIRDITTNMVNYLWHEIDIKSPQLLQCDGSESDLTEWKSTLYISLCETFTRVQNMYGVLCATKVRNTKMMMEMIKKITNKE